MKQPTKWALTGAAAGIVCGLFGGGGGMLAVPLLQKSGLSSRQTFATSLGVILPLTVASLIVALFRQGFDWQVAWPYLVGGGIGGFIGGRFFKNIPTLWLHRVFGVLLLWGGFKAVFGL